MEQISQPFTQTGDSDAISRALPQYLTESVHHASRIAGCRVALRILWSSSYVVRALATDLRCHTGSGAVAGRTRSRGPAQIGAHCGHADSAIDILLSRASLEPGIFGISRPVLVWPEGISEHLEDAHLEAILAHELWHVRRRDNLAAAIHMFVEAMFWFHPLVWWLGARLVEERERACDEEVLESGRRTARLCGEHFEGVRILRGISAGLRLWGNGLRS